MSVLIAFVAPVLTFGLYAIIAACVFHCRVIRRPIVFMAWSFVPFLVIQSVVLWICLPHHEAPHSADEPAVQALAYVLPFLIAVLLGLAYLQFYCLIEFSISLRMLEQFLAAPRRELSFRDLRRAYPLEDVIARKCEAAGAVGLLRARSLETGVVLDMPSWGLRVIRSIDRLKVFLNWNDAG